MTITWERPVSTGAYEARVGDIVTYISTCTGRSRVRLGIINRLESKPHRWQKDRMEIHMGVTLPGAVFKRVDGQYQYVARLIGAHIVDPYIIATIHPKEILELNYFSKHMPSSIKTLDAINELHSKMVARYHELNPPK